ncbi:MAG TPA: ABC transporter permease [Bryobacteraceae bacterium]|nr:ABC transporter permease [Bryobacteraceae bacterium]
MKWITRTASLFRLLFRKQRLEDQLDDEVRACFDLLTDRYRAQGMSPSEARRAARVEFEGTEQVKEQVRDARVGAGVESLLRDLRYAIRALGRSKGFTAVTVITLALGFGVNTAIFSVVYAVLLRPLPYAQPEQLALIWSNFHSSGPRAPSSGPIVREIQQRSRLLQEVAGIWVGTGTFTGEANPEQVKVASVTTNFLSMLGVKPAVGRVFLPEEKFGGRPAIVISYGLWQRRFGGDPNIAGKGIPFQGASLTILGVMPQDFQLHFPQDSNVPPIVDAYVPFGDLARFPRTLYYIRMLARMKPGVTAAQAQEDLNSVAAQVRATYTEYSAENLTFEVAPLQRDTTREIRPTLIALFAGAGLVLLICCVNSANLLLARATGRRKEIAVRASLGASNGRIVRQLLVEGFVLCTVAGTVGVALGWLALKALLQLQPDYLARLGNVGLNAPVLAFMAVAAILSVLLIGLAPSLESFKFDLIESLRDGGRTSQTPARRGLRAALIVSEVTLGFILVVGAGLMIRTFEKIQQVRPGFEPQRLLTFEIDLPGSRYRNDVARAQFVKDWEQQLAAIPGVESVGAISHLPLDDYPNWYSPYRPEGVSENESAALLADHRAVTIGYLRAMQTRLLEGRYFDDRDRNSGQRVVIVDESLARSTWPGQSAVGKKIETEHFSNGGFKPGWTEVVGVVEHIRHHSISKQLRGEIYIPFEQSSRPHLSYVLRTRVEPLSLADPVRDLLRQRDRDLALSKLRPMTMYMDRAKSPARFTAVLAAIFGALALVLAAIGIYGVVHYSVSRRTHEMGVRMALGASASDVLRLVLREGLVLTAIGMALGLAGALAVSRSLQGLIYGISSVDPLTYAAALLVIAAAAILGCWRPARLAARSNPLDTIRTE